jgi:tetratricopeptide (TPR) repeat protein
LGERRCGVVRSRLSVVVLIVLLVAGGIWYFTRDTRTPEERAEELWDQACDLKEHGEFLGAIRCLKEYIKLDQEKHPRAYGMLAFCYDEIGQVEMAQQHYRRALELDPRDANARVLYAGCLLEAAPDGNTGWQMADPELRKLSDEDLKTRGVAYNLACVCASNGKADVALQYLSLAIKQDPSYRDLARRDKDFDSIRRTEQFKRLVP